MAHILDNMKVKEGIAPPLSFWVRNTIIILVDSRGNEYKVIEWKWVIAPWTAAGICMDALGDEHRFRVEFAPELGGDPAEAYIT